MYRIGELWVDGKLGIGEEHVASNVARELVTSVSRKGRRRGRQARVLICTPSGEEHSLSCHVLQSFLQSRGFDVSNISPSAPAETVLYHIEKEKPDIVMISITLGENVPAGQRLISSIRSASDVPVLVGGQQVSGGQKFKGATACSEPLERVPGLVRGLLRPN
ncbi:5-methyltetrahydrofolate--homocysteine S-methyltransferase [Cenarchaeum symbiosum A]|uniref:5-methyltetrahydrofolate--homocysteine S-methyltransferase n=1 Tax=Cenarchaeum symbiosum (strain A) TaxID=414004 RepID=A0RWH1_CENSY|nr:5-methyltetrahydrofolate--homocysteine S-methyltransferase [Cenarchaeum symbiosum A]